MLSDFFVDFVKMYVTETVSSLGAVVRTYTDGEPFRAGIFRNQSAEMRLAEQNGLRSVFTMKVPLETVLRQNDVVKHVHTGRLYRITSNSADRQTPAISGIPHANVTAEVIEE